MIVKITHNGQDIYIDIDGITNTYTVVDVNAALRMFIDKYSVNGNTVFVDGVQVFPVKVPFDYMSLGLLVVGGFIMFALLRMKQR